MALPVWVISCSLSVLSVVSDKYYANIGSTYYNLFWLFNSFISHSLFSFSYPSASPSFFLIFVLLALGKTKIRKNGIG
jgi:hypothetical protein